MNPPDGVRKADDAPPGTEAELEAFRQQWRDEVSARSKRPVKSAAPTITTAAEKQSFEENASARPPTTTGSSTARRKDAVDYSEDVEPRAYHDLPDREEQLKLGFDGQLTDRGSPKEPTTALEHYERAVEKETQGQLGDSMRHYRTAFKLDDGVHEAYKRKHFPPSSFTKPKPSAAGTSGVVSDSQTQTRSADPSEALPPTMQQLIDSYSLLQIEPPEPATSASPAERCAIAELPEELLSTILSNVAAEDVASFARLAQVCKRLAYLAMTEEAIWKHVALGEHFGFAAMHYDYICDVEGRPLVDPYNDFASLLDDSDEDTNLQPHEESHSALTPSAARAAAFDALTEQLLHKTYASSWRRMFRARPRIRFNGCYISTVNYTRAGANSTNTLTWGAPIHVVTYFRYLRFFRDGSVISLLTTSEPADVVHHLTKTNLHGRHHASGLPSSVMKDALRGRWRLTGPVSTAPGRNDPPSEPESEGDVMVETEGVVPKYTYRLHLALANAGKGTRNNKLAWKGFWSYNKLTDDLGEFGLRNDKAYYWSRVRSYGLGYEDE